MPPQVHLSTASLSCVEFSLTVSVPVTKLSEQDRKAQRTLPSKGQDHGQKWRGTQKSEGSSASGPRWVVCTQWKKKNTSGCMFTGGGWMRVQADCALSGEGENTRRDRPPSSKSCWLWTPRNPSLLQITRQLAYVAGCWKAWGATVGMRLKPTLPLVLSV